MHGKKIRLSKSSLSQAEKTAVMEVLDKEFLGMGEEVQAFEREIKAYLQTSKEVICVNTGTSALHLALEALDIGPGDEILVPSLTYVASYQAIAATGAKPVSTEILENSFFIDIDDARHKITPNTKAIMPVHYASDSRHMPELYAFAKEKGIRVIEDAAHSFGCKREGRFIGVEGDIICFSFDGIKNITSGEGGAILSEDPKVIQRVKDARLLGVEKDTDKRYAGARSWDFDVKHRGFRYHMSNIFAAIGRQQLQKIEKIREKRQAIVSYYLKHIQNPEITFLDLDYPNIISHIFVVKAKKRDALREHLLNHNIECGIHYKPNHMLTMFKSDTPLPVTEKVYEEILTLPCHFDLTQKEQDYIIQTMEEFYRD